MHGLLHLSGIALAYYHLTTPLAPSEFLLYLIGAALTLAGVHAITTILATSLPRPN
ncbi:hypothetical protein B0T26DRAFT_689767 [Lasiosphaeria miniovina]|uniref:Uncharacterized protein n=1 Tax=Lasiosphaeria miniovina TaxID=1954250 RepID=A0AA40BIH1_9PEZI|nr:uncharacterized protein B0T26DRAFT_689767 [Lasiosphaeria miniovina]KAK0734833.1 hypothetical protein B0T26DRAFT_689767 [Lasiosphaeria miniovina]